MTRGEAIDIWRRETQERGGGGPIGALVALGILKLDEPKPAAQRLADELDTLGYSTGEINEFYDCVARANVKIVEK